MQMRPRNKLDRADRRRADLDVLRFRHSRHHRIRSITIPEPTGSTFRLWVGVPLTLLWYVGMMNAINFLDGLDGLLAGVAAISSSSSS